jgi:hypothetical protein
LHGFLLFLCAHPFVVRTTTFTFTYCGVQGEWTQLLWPTWGVDGWMNGGGMDQSYYQLNWDSSTIESGKSSSPVHWWLTWILFIVIDSYQGSIHWNSPWVHPS